MVTFGVDAKDLERLTDTLANPNLARVGDGMEESLKTGASVWRLAASGVRLPGMTRTVNSDAYGRSITYAQRGLLAGVVYSTDGPLDAGMTDPKPAWDMKSGLLNGPHARRGKNGRYNIIPFRHKPENLSNAAVMALIQNMRNYRSDYGARSKLTPAGEYAWTTGHESGIRMGDTGPVTWRTVSDRSPAASWWYPARPENDIANAVWAVIEEQVGERLLFAWAEALGL